MYNNENTPSEKDEQKEEKIFKCCFFDCEEKFMEKIAFVNHLSKHSNQKTFKCDSCPKIYLCPLTLRIHVTKAHTEVSETVKK